MDADAQLALGRLRKLKEKLDITAKSLRKTVDSNRRNEANLNRLIHKKQNLEDELIRLDEVERLSSLQINADILRETDNPQQRERVYVLKENEMVAAEELWNPTIDLRNMMNELLVRTTLNEHVAHKEMEDQENDFNRKVRDALTARKLLHGEVSKGQKKAESLLVQQKETYERAILLKSRLAVCQSETWLATIEGNRLTDMLNIISKEPIARQCEYQKKTTHGRRHDAEPIEREERREIRKEAVDDHSGFVVRSRSRIRRRSVSSEKTMETQPDREHGGRDLEMNETEEEISLPTPLRNAIQQAILQKIGLNIQF